MLFKAIRYTAILFEELKLFQSLRWHIGVILFQPQNTQTLVNMFLLITENIKNEII